jgi:hypothetical protein
MRYYLFSFGDKGVCVRFGLLANSREEAVALAKEELGKYRRPEPEGLPEEFRGKIGRPEFGIEMASSKFELMYVAFFPDDITEADIKAESDPRFRPQ